MYAGYRFYFSSKSQTPSYTPPPQITIGKQTFTLDIADTDEKRSQGLSGRGKLEETQGMLFLFPQKDMYAFWMKDMLFPLDLIWIDEDTVVDISENVPIPFTATYLPRYQPKAPVNRVLEVNSGLTKKYGIIPGMKVAFSGLENIQPK